MANNASNYLENKLLLHIFANKGGSSFTSPSNLFVSLHTGSPGEANDGSNECTGTNYARVTTGDWTVSGNAADNDGAITFAAAGNSWGTISHIGIYDASTSGNLIFYGALSVSKAVTTGDTFSINAGALDITLE